MIKYSAVFVGLIFIALYLYGLFTRTLFFPSDILLTIPQYASEMGWQRVENSLLADPVFQFEPWRHYAKERIVKGEIPFINDQNALGSPFLANPINALFFPLTLLYILLPVQFSLIVIHFLKFYFLFLFSFLYFQSLFLRKPLSYLGAFLATFASFPIVWTLWPQTNVYLFFPLLLYITEKLTSGTRRNYWLVLLSVVYSLAILAGHPETLFHIGTIHFFYIVIRLKSLRLILKTFLFIFLGFLLSAFQLLPFLEYLLHSYMLEYRTVLTEHSFYHPLSSVIVNVIPFLFGSPHLGFYKPVWSGTNFQEIIGGYVGPSIFLLGFISIIKLKKTSLSVFWISVIVVTFGISYGVFPFTLINELPVFSAGANHRYVAFGGFGLIVLSMLSLQTKKLSVNMDSLKVLFVLLLSVGVLLYVFPTELFGFFDTKYVEFGNFLKEHVLLIIITTGIFFVSAYYYVSRHSKVSVAGMFLAVACQTLVLFFSYNPFVSSNLYYPESALTRTLQSLPKGVYLEIGNPTLPENINLMYSLSTLENYDALEIASFRKIVDEKLPETNHWGNREQISQEALDYFGISYIVSDYDIRYKKVDVFQAQEDVLPELLEGQKITLPLDNLPSFRAIRFLPATYNRVNSCELVVSLIENDQILQKEVIECQKLINNTFYTLTFPTQTLSSDNSYSLSIVSSAKTPENAVSFFGDGKSPYLSVVTNEMVLSNVTLLEQRADYFVFVNNSVQFVKTNGTAQVTERKPEYISMYVDQHEEGMLEIKRAAYPGWSARIDGEKSGLVSSPLLALSVPKGKHFVEFEYTPYSFYLGAAISVLSFFILLGTLLKDRYNSSRQKK